MTKKQIQIKVTPSGGELKIIELLSRSWDESAAGIVMMGFRKAIPALMSDYEQFQRLQGGGTDANPLRLLLLRLAAGEPVPEPELTMLAHDCGVPIETLKQIRDCLIREADHVRTV